MWQCGVVLVSCLLGTAFGDQKYSKSAPSVAKQFSVDVGNDEPYQVKYSIVNGEVSGRSRGVREVLYPLGVVKLQEGTAGKGPADVEVKSSRLKVEVPLSRRYFNPALKKAPPEALGLQAPIQSDFLLDDVPFLALPFQEEDFLGFAPNGLPVENRRSLQLAPVVSGPGSPMFSTRPPWIPRGSQIDVRPQRAKIIKAGSIPPNLLSGLSNNRKTSGSVNVGDLIKQVEQLIIASQNTNSTAGKSDRRWKHISL